jgi:hypothetical protein
MYHNISIVRSVARKGLRIKPLEKCKEVLGTVM